MRSYYPKLVNIAEAVKRIQNICGNTPLELNSELTRRHNAIVYLKREDLNGIRSYKMRGAYNKLSSLSTKSVVTCSAGNHAQGVANSCNKLNIHCDVFMPSATTQQKVNKVKHFGGAMVNIFLEGETFDDAFDIAKRYSIDKKMDFIHPFDDEKVIEGQATVGYELFAQMKGNPIDYIFLPIGGGGLAAGVSAYIKEVSPHTKIIGVEPLGAASMTAALKADKLIKLDKINTFVDGASIKQVGQLNFPICKKNLDDVLVIDEGHVCSKIIQMYNENGLIIEPAGVLSLCALDNYPKVSGTNVVCIISGGNSDIYRMPEILERSLTYEGLKHYFKIDFAQKPGSLKQFVVSVLGPQDDIIYFRYSRTINKDMGPVVVGIQVKSKEDINQIIEKMEFLKLNYQKLVGLPN